MNNETKNNDSDDRRVVQKHSFLTNCHIALAITGSIASVESVKLIRELRRFGAHVQVYLSKNAAKFISPLSLEWASISIPITASTGKAEHIFSDDLLLVAPATLDSVAKAATAISDDHVSTLISSALGVKFQQSLTLEKTLGKDKLGQQAKAGNSFYTAKACLAPPILFAPAMHSSLANNPFFQEHKRKLEACGVLFLSPLLSESKAKIPDAEELAWHVCHAYALSQKNSLQGKKVFINAGSVPSKIDDVRRLSNFASAQTGIDLAYQAYARGAKPCLLLPWDKKRDSRFPFESVGFRNFEDFAQKTLSLIAKKQPDLGIFTAAVSDYKIARPKKGKPSSKQGLHDMKFLPTEKIVQAVRQKFPSLAMATFKLVSGLTLEETRKQAEKLCLDNGYEFVIANRLEDVQKAKLAAEQVADVSMQIPRYVASKASKTQSTGQVTNNAQLAEKIYSSLAKTSKTSDNP